MDRIKVCQKFVCPLLGVVFSLALFLPPQSVYSQEQPTPSSIPYPGAVVVTGGDSFETAEELPGPGSYELGATVPADSKRYFEISGYRAGEQIKVTGNFDGEAIVSVDLYDSQRSSLTRSYELASDTEPHKLSWLDGSEKTSYSYYIVLGVSPDGDLTSASLEIEKVSLFDGGVEGDAGETYEKAVPLVEGSYTGHLAGEDGSDKTDFYSVELNKGQVLIVTVTPPGDRALGNLAVYDSSMQSLYSPEGWPNKGAVVEAPVLAEKTGTYFIEIDNSYSDVNSPVQYDFEIAIKPLSEAQEYFDDEEILVGGGDDTTVTGAEDAAGKVPGGLLAKFTQGLNTTLVSVAGIGGLVAGFVLGFFTARALSGRKKKTPKTSLSEQQD